MVIMMADESDDVRDVVVYWKLLNEGYDCVFGSRFMRGGGVVDYPRLKLFLNRMANKFLQALFRVKHNDITNAFKAYRKTTIDGCRPLIAPHFNLTVELPLKAIVRGYSWKSVPITWRNRRTGSPKLKIKEMGSRYYAAAARHAAGARHELADVLAFLGDAFVVLRQALNDLVDDHLHLAPRPETVERLCRQARYRQGR